MAVGEPSRLDIAGNKGIDLALQQKIPVRCHEQVPPILGSSLGEKVQEQAEARRADMLSVHFLAQRLPNPRYLLSSIQTTPILWNIPSQAASNREPPAEEPCNLSAHYD